MPTKSKKVVEAVELAEVPTAKSKSKKRTAVKSAPVTRFPICVQGAGDKILDPALQSKFADFLDGMTEEQFKGACAALNWAFCGGLASAVRETGVPNWGHKQFIATWKQGHTTAGSITPKL